jgi:hypothetical protein
VKLIQQGNSKLVNQYMFNIPANAEICGRECPGCYAIKFYKMRETVRKGQDFRYEESKKDTFVQNINTELSAIKKKFKYVRVHGSSGEFYSQVYVDKWYEIAKTNKKITFYALTKRLKDFDFDKLKQLDNFVVIDSMFNGKINYGTAEELSDRLDTMFLCPATNKDTKDNTICGSTCVWCMSKVSQNNGVLFIKH